MRLWHTDKRVIHLFKIGIWKQFFFDPLFSFAVRLTLGCSREVILVHLVLNNAFYISISDLAIIENLVTRLGFLDWSGIKWGLNYKPSESYIEI